MKLEQKIIITQKELDDLHLLIGRIVDASNTTSDNKEFDNAVQKAYLKLYDIECEAQTPCIATILSTAQDAIYNLKNIRGYGVLYKVNGLTDEQIEDIQSTLNGAYAYAKMAWEDLQRYNLENQKNGKQKRNQRRTCEHYV